MPLKRKRSSQYNRSQWQQVPSDWPDLLYGVPCIVSLILREVGVQVGGNGEHVGEGTILRNYAEEF